MKTCTKCGETKPLEAFYRCERGIGGVRGDCKACVNATGRARYGADLDESREQSRIRSQARRDEDPQRERDRHKKWRDENRAAHYAVTKAWRDRNRDAVNRRSAEYRSANLDACRERAKKSKAKKPWLAKEGEDRRRANLADSYVKRAIASQCGVAIRDIPQPLVELKRAQLRLVRELRKAKP